MVQYSNANYADKSSVLQQFLTCFQSLLPLLSNSKITSIEEGGEIKTEDGFCKTDLYIMLYFPVTFIFSLPVYFIYIPIF